MGTTTPRLELFETRNVSLVRVSVQLFNMAQTCTPAETASLTKPESPRRTINFKPDSLHVLLPYYQLGCHYGQGTHCVNALVEVLLTCIDMSLNLPKDVNVYVTVKKFYTFGRISRPHVVIKHLKIAPAKSPGQPSPRPNKS
ncbi:hypothetical protein MRX96_006105 [Rhipicephalus microplus]